MSAASCERTLDELASLLDGSAPEELLAHAASCDTCRDARYDAERVARAISEVGHDFQLPAELLQRLLQPTPTLAQPAVSTPAALAAPIAPHQAEPRPVATPAKRPWKALAQRWAVPVLAAAAAAGILLGRGQHGSTSADDPELTGAPWRGKVAKVLSHGGKLEICAPRGSACHAARTGDDVPAGSWLRTDASTLVELSFTDGSSLSLDRETELRLSPRGRGGELSRGAVVADVQHVEGSGARFGSRHGHVDVIGTKLAMRADDESVVVHVARGEVRLADNAGHDVVVLAGEEGRLDAGSRPVTSPGAALGEALGWSEAVQSDPDADEPEPRPRSLGELRAKKPGERDERAGAVRLQSHAVRVSIAGGVARTEVEEVFSNQTDDVLEGIFRLPLPPDAKIERLALDVDGRLEEGAFVDRERAAAIWRGAIVNAAPQLRQEIKDDIVWVPGPWRDPALLEWQRGGRFELRVYPIPRRGSRRVVLAYSQLVKQAAGVRHYSYPLGFDPSGNAAPVDFSLRVQLRGHDPAFRVRTPGWDMKKRDDDGSLELSYDAKSLVPNGDFAIDYALPERAAELSAWAFESPGSKVEPAYVAVALRPRLPKPAGRGPGRAVALVVDASRSVFGENYRRATALATRLARDLGSDDRVTVLACDVGCRQMPGDLLQPGAETARATRRFLEHETPDGASDVTLAVERGFAALGTQGRTPHVVYIGDGTATVGPIRPASIELAVRSRLPASGRVTALGVGPESDTEALLALCRGGAGSALPYVPGQPLADLALAAISAISGASLADVRLELPSGMTSLSPARFDPIVAGSELILTGRLLTPHVEGELVLRGNVAGRPFEQRYALNVTASSSAGNAFVPRLYAAGRIADLERDGSADAKREAIELSTQHRVASRYTSLLVLESEAMYRAFGLESASKVPEYTADLEAEGSSASGELALNDDAAPSDGDEKKRKAKAEAPLAEAEEARPDSLAAPKAARAAGGGLSGLGNTARGDAMGPSASQARPAPARKPSTAFAPPPAPSPMPLEPAPNPFRVEGRDLLELPSRPRLIPMRRIWERRGEIITSRFVPTLAGASNLAEAQRTLNRDDSRRQNLKRAFALSSAAGDLGEAARLAERWLEREPLDPEAITALADVEARRGHRELSIRMLGSVLDVRPGDTAAHKRLARLERWSGHAELACRHSIAMAEGKSQDLALVADAVRCARQTSLGVLADALLQAASPTDRASIEARQALAPTDELSGDVRVEANWSGDVDLDLALLDTDGHRVSWLGAATRSVISARDTTSSSRESLALRGAAAGEYVVELTRGDGSGTAQGELVVNVAGTIRRIPFSFDGDRKAVAVLRLSVEQRLVPL